ncbi:hypothetical protein IMZ48_25060 [Candidatus Bathyarchaeota archaeon]|nr:hypothetical protein [Candidatus Bathyarchaeota archaeon]
MQFIGNLDVDVKQPLVAPEEDTGPVVKALLGDVAGKSVIGARAWMTVREFMQVLTAATGMRSEAIQLPEGQSRFADAGELRLEFEESMAYFNEIGYTGGDPDVVDPKDVSINVWHP